jgi:hypothetical protein
MHTGCNYQENREAVQYCTNARDVRRAPKSPYPLKQQLELFTRSTIN